MHRTTRASTIMADLSETTLPSIVDFYAHKDVLITGSTGFLGKCLLEKVLRSVPDVGSVFVITRAKRGKSPEQRTKDLLMGPLFERLRNEAPGAIDKVVPVVGDIQKPELGLKREDQEMLQDRVSIVFHLAATVRFEAPIREALSKNVGAVCALVALCRNMKNLKSFVHVSSAYSQCNRRGVIDEISYPTPVAPLKLLGLLDWMTDEQLNTLTPTLIKGYPNTYTYTKALAEQVLMEEAKGLPLAIYRPSIIGASLREPVEGWVDSLHGPTGLFIAVGKGFLRVMRCDEYRKADFVPVDLVNNLLIAIGWITAVSPSPSPIFYNYSSSTLKPMNWLQLYNYFMTAHRKYPLDKIFRRPWVCKARPAKLYPFWNFILHLVPGFVGDIILRLLQKKPFFVKTYMKINSALQQLDYFTQLTGDGPIATLTNSSPSCRPRTNKRSISTFVRWSGRPTSTTTSWE